jgi:basic membrane lipoprotein Med (substrate-binding protein (PBP1-ABC) superfamily)
MSTTATSMVPADQLEWKDLLQRLADGAWKVNQTEYKKLGLKNASEVLFPPASEVEIAITEEKVGALPEDFKNMVRVANGYLSML